MIQKEIHYFFTALMFFTRIPCPEIKNFESSYLQKSRRYFPLVGWIVGSVAVIVLAIFLKLFSLELAVIASTISGILLTGAFHEDGFADVCDAFGGGYGKEQILRIMKDSRVGAYGAIGIFLLLLLKLQLLIDIGKLDVSLLLISLLNAHASSRYVASTFVHSHAYVQSSDNSKSKPMASERLSKLEMLFSFSFALIPLLLYSNWKFALALPISFVAKFYLGRIFQKEIGGYTGDCLGAVQQLSEIFFYLGIIAIWKFI